MDMVAVSMVVNSMQASRVNCGSGRIVKLKCVEIQSRPPFYTLDSITSITNDYAPKLDDKQSTCETLVGAHGDLVRKSLIIGCSLEHGGQYCIACCLFL